MGAIDEAFLKCPRENFLLPEDRGQKAIDAPIPIGYGQTNSQPYTVRKMLEWLDVQPGQKVLDVGSGSGWTSCLLAHLAGKKGHVYAVELVPELVKFGRDNAKSLSVNNVSFHQAGKVFGKPDTAPHDRILVSASAKEMPEDLIVQLGSPGRMVIPVRNSIWVVEKDSSGEIELQEYPGFMFVPLIG